MHLGTPINNPTRHRPSLEERIDALKMEIRALRRDCYVQPDLFSARAIADQMDRADRRITMVRHGVSLVRSEAKMIIATENRLAAAGKVVCQ